MNSRFYIIKLFLLWLIVLSPVDAQTLGLKPQPIFDQCPELKSGAGEDAVALSVAALKDKDAAKRGQAAQRLAASCDLRAVEPLIDALKDESHAVRAASVEALGKLGDASAVEPLVELIGDKDWRVRMALISSLASFKTFGARNMVLNGIAFTAGADPDNEDDLRVRCAAILTCNQLMDVRYSRKAILFLYNFLASEHPTMRKFAAETMHELKSTRNAASELTAILKNDHNPELRRWAAEWMGKIGLDAKREALSEAAAKDSDATVRKAAAEALARLGTAR
jgi:HEAT repeat protein